MSAERLLFRIAAAALLLCSLAMGGMDQSGDINASNMTRQEFSIIVPSASLQDSFIETDAPDMAPPEDFRRFACPPGADGKPVNHPGNLAGVCEGLAEILGLSPGALAGLTDANARALFG